MAFSIGPGLWLLALIFVVPWAVVVCVSLLARAHFKRFMPFYIGGAFAAEMLLFTAIFLVI